MYTIKQAALRSGVNVPLLRAWERRYGIVAPTRTDTGYRLYDEAAIERLRTMRALVDEGWSARQAAERVTAAQPEELETLAGAVAAVERGNATDAISAFVAGAARLDGAAIERALDDMFASGSFERIVEDRLYPALEGLGEGWARGEVDVAGEHAASSAVVRRLSMIFDAAAAAEADAPRPVLVGLPPGVRHEVAALAYATALRRAGIPVLYLGADVPVASWVAAADRTNARAVALGAVMTDDVAAADAVVSALREAPRDLVVAVGGRHAELIGNGDVLRLPERLRDAVGALADALEATNSLR
ncbi:MAG: MerR family transcriptional regulator [Chloroflexi bacterium]|nr:MerR family transcriptional regulator [Chloroflexota bacterium]